jgi:hypothetical protein
MHGLDHGAGPGFPILGPRATKVCTFNDLGGHGIFLDYNVPMVFLGLLFGLQFFSNKWLYWKLGTFWFDAYPRDAFTWITTYS